jgi:hypothetical protein
VSAEERPLYDVMDADAMAMVVQALRWMARGTSMPPEREKEITSAIFATRVPADTSPQQAVAAAHRVLRGHIHRNRIGLMED